MSTSFAPVAAIAAGLSIASIAQAGITSPLSEWNLIVRNNLNITSEVDGSALIGGNVTGTSNYAVHGVTASSGDGLAVGGNISAGTTVNINNGGHLRISGSVLGAANRNGGGQLINDPGVAAAAGSALAQLTAVSSYLWTLTPNGSLNGAGNMNAVPTLIDGQLVAVYSITQAQIDGLGQLHLNLGSAQSVIINVASTGGLIDFIAPPNLIGDFNQTNSARILWNFADATTVRVNNTFNGSILATGADLQLLGGGINGSVAVDNVSVMNAEIRRSNYNGFIPTPASMPLLGLAAAFATRRRRR